MQQLKKFFGGFSEGGVLAIKAALLTLLIYTFTMLWLSL